MTLRARDGEWEQIAPAPDKDYERTLTPQERVDELRYQCDLADHARDFATVAELLSPGALLLTADEREAEIERVAAALYERAMQERRSFSNEPERFSREWGDGQGGDSWRRGWREEARALLPPDPNLDGDAA